MCLTTKFLYVPYYYTSYALKKQAAFHIYKKSPSPKEHLRSNDEGDFLISGLYHLTIYIADSIYDDMSV